MKEAIKQLNKTIDILIEAGKWHSPECKKLQKAHLLLTK